MLNCVRKSTKDKWGIQITWGVFYQQILAKPAFRLGYDK